MLVRADRVQGPERVAHSTCCELQSATRFTCRCAQTGKAQSAEALTSLCTLERSLEQTLRIGSDLKVERREFTGVWGMCSRWNARLEGVTGSMKHVQGRRESAEVKGLEED